MEQQIDEKKKQKIKLNRMQWTIIIGLLEMGRCNLCMRW